MSKHTKRLAKVVREYGAAMRGDWSQIDGRGVRGDMDRISHWIESGESPSIFDMRDELGVCYDGNGHWAGFRWGNCDEDECPLSYERESKEM